MGCWVVMGWTAFVFNNSAWDWESGLHTGGLVYSCGVGCCVVVGGAVFYLTSRPVIGRKDFRGIACCREMIWGVVL